MLQSSLKLINLRQLSDYTPKYCYFSRFHKVRNNVVLGPRTKNLFLTLSHRKTRWRRGLGEVRKLESDEGYANGEEENSHWGYIMKYLKYWVWCFRLSAVDRKKPLEFSVRKQTINLMILFSVVWEWVESGSRETIEEVWKLG